ncbi:MAG: hypothetical protein MUE54_05055 [Anaerolineae bacterium]|jgi:hypothetical protein|nr:hypothetical protein [Anaerolineae bacterium]
MKPLNFDNVCHHIQINIAQFYERRLSLIKQVKLGDWVRCQNWYRLRIESREAILTHLEAFLDDALRVEEEKLFEDFLAELAIFVVSETCGGNKSIFTDVDYEFEKNQTHYLLKIKRFEWLKHQKKQIISNIEYAKQNVNAQKPNLTIQPLIGRCYGKTKSRMTNRGVLQLYGQSFWHFISDDPRLYMKIMQPLGHEARKHNGDWNETKVLLTNLLIIEFYHQFCLPNGAIDWEKLIQFNSENLISPA